MWKIVTQRFLVRGNDVGGIVSRRFCIKEKIYKKLLLSRIYEMA